MSVWNELTMFWRMFCVSMTVSRTITSSCCRVSLSNLEIAFKSTVCSMALSFRNKCILAALLSCSMMSSSKLKNADDKKASSSSNLCAVFCICFPARFTNFVSLYYKREFVSVILLFPISNELIESKKWVPFLFFLLLDVEGFISSSKLSTDLTTLFFNSSRYCFFDEIV